MHRPIRTAVAAAAGWDLLRTIACLLAGSGVELTAATQNGAEAIECLQTHRPDLLIADMELPAIDGATLVERAIGTFCLPVRPRAILLCYPEFEAHNHAKIEALGAVFIEKPIDAATFSDAITHLSQRMPIFPESECRCVEKLLGELGFPDHIGSEVLKYAVLAGAQDAFLMGKIGAELIPFATGMCGVSASQAERAMRYAIAKAWQSDKFENQYRIFLDTVDAGRGQPTLSEMISRLADILRLEG